MSRKVYVTGMGISCGNGGNVQEFWTRLKAGESGLKVVPEWEHMDIRLAGLVDTTDFLDEELETIRKEGVKRTVFGRRVLAETLVSAGLNPQELEEIGIFLGVDFYASDELFLDTLIHLYPQGKGEDRWERFNLGYASNMAVRNIFKKDPRFDFVRLNSRQIYQSGVERDFRKVLKVPGLSRTYNNLCVSSAQSIGEAFELIQSGQQDIVLAGGLEEYSFISAFTFSKLGVYVNAHKAEDGCLPFDERRKGTVLGEGCGLLILESEEHMKKRKGKALAEILGYGTSNNRYHVTNSPSDGRGLVASMEEALNRAGLSPEEIDLVVAHGTGTFVNDLSESVAINKVMPHRPPVHSLKSYVGHTLSAAGVLNVISGILEMQNEYLIPTLYLKNPAKNCNLNHIPASGMPRKVRRFLSNAAGFGGFNGTLILGEAPC